MRLDLDGKAVLVTGGTGSFGSRFVRTVIQRYSPSKVIVFSRDEQKQFDMEHDPVLKGHDAMRYFIGDVRDVDRLEMAMRGIDYVIHAAALKHVTVAEYNPFECIRTNVQGAENVVTAAIRANVRHVVALSTDKAVNPINLYGASKLASDKIFVAAQSLSGNDGPKFSVVRYGNVIGSRGSLVPFFKKLIDEGATNLPITDPRMTRFFLTVQEGVDFVLNVLAVMQGREIFVPKIPSMRIVDVAAAIAPDLPIQVIGIRPGEKLNELLITEDDARNTLDLGDRYVVCPSFKTGLLDYYLQNGGQAVAEDFRYASHENTQWMDAEDFCKKLPELNHQ
jgi:UDP-N-acetylglucosamine 4,6-dehydratase/5-epimerase